MRGLRDTRLQQLRHEATRMCELTRGDDQREAYAALQSALIAHELKQPFPDWARIRKLARNLENAATVSAFVSIAAGL